MVVRTFIFSFLHFISHIFVVDTYRLAITVSARRGIERNDIPMKRLVIRTRVDYIVSKSRHFREKKFISSIKIYEHIYVVCNKNTIFIIPTMRPISIVARSKSNFMLLLCACEIY